MPLTLGDEQHFARYATRLGVAERFRGLRERELARDLRLDGAFGHQLEDCREVALQLVAEAVRAELLAGPQVEERRPLAVRRVVPPQQAPEQLEDRHPGVAGQI